METMIPTTRQNEVSTLRQIQLKMTLSIEFEHANYDNHDAIKRGVYITTNSTENDTFNWVGILQTMKPTTRHNEVSTLRQIQLKLKLLIGVRIMKTIILTTRQNEVSTLRQIQLKMTVLIGFF